MDRPSPAAEAPHPHALNDAGAPGPSGHDAGPSHNAPASGEGTLKAEHHAEQEPVDSGVDAGSASEYDQDNSGDHLLEAHGEDNFSDEGYAQLRFSHFHGGRSQNSKVRRLRRVFFPFVYPVRGPSRRNDRGEAVCFVRKA